MWNSERQDMQLNRRRLTTLMLGAAMAFPARAALARSWQSAHFADHPLVGKVFDRDGNATSLDAIKQRATDAPYVMLGEIHPNPDHHALQAEVLAHMITAGRKPALVFEMVNRAQQPVLDHVMANPSASADMIAERLEWAASGWPDFAMYRPLFEIALTHQLPLRAGNLEKSTIRRLGGREGSILTDSERAALGLDQPLPEAAGAALLEVIRTSHCNMLPDTVLPMMRDIQRARDFVMADAMMNAANTDGAVLICGAGHARLDWGAGLLVDRAAPGKLVSVGFSEVADGLDIEDIDTGAHHFTMLTPRADVTDHCEAFAKSLNRQ
jgi:uncharacterized iron-regulated protein